MPPRAPLPMSRVSNHQLCQPRAGTAKPREQTRPSTQKFPDTLCGPCRRLASPPSHPAHTLTIERGREWRTVCRAMLKQKGCCHPNAGVTLHQRSSDLSALVACVEIKSSCEQSNIQAEGVPAYLSSPDITGDVFRVRFSDR